MKILVVGGTGLLGGHAAAFLEGKGHEVSIAARNPPQATSPMAQMPFLKGDYVAEEFTKDDLAGFDAIVFAAGNDIRHVPPDADQDAYWEKANVIAIPRFFALARDAGVKKAVYIGSFYPQAVPDLIEKIPYVRGRHLSDVGLRATATPDFQVNSVNAPFVLGALPGLHVPMFEAYTRYAEGKLGLPAFGPAGGTNFISCQSLSEAVWGALERGESGKAYLVGDENLTFAKYFELFFRAAGNDAEVPALDQEHPLLPDGAIYTGRGNTLVYEPDPAEAALLGYRRNDIANAVAEIVAQYRSA
jgi:nucleoside-diphosphate-sugar epimerase